MPLPTGVRLLARSDPGRLAWAWAINGAASVLGASIAMLLAVLFGFTVVAWCGAAAYGCALVLALVLSRRATEAETSASGSAVP